MLLRVLPWNITTLYNSYAQILTKHIYIWRKVQKIDRKVNRCSSFFCKYKDSSLVLPGLVLCKMAVRADEDKCNCLVSLLSVLKYWHTALHIWTWHCLKISEKTISCAGVVREEPLTHCVILAKLGYEKTAYGVSNLMNYSLQFSFCWGIAPIFIICVFMCSPSGSFGSSSCENVTLSTHISDSNFGRKASATGISEPPPSSVVHLGPPASRDQCFCNI